MIVPFAKGSQPDSPPARPQIPEQYLLAAMGQAHVEGKFHVYDPALRWTPKDDMLKLPSTVSPTGPKGIDRLNKPLPSDRTEPIEKEI